jgi:hypothetical protein
VSAMFCHAEHDKRQGNSNGTKTFIFKNVCYLKIFTQGDHKYFQRNTFPKLETFKSKDTGAFITVLAEIPGVARDSR